MMRRPPGSALLPYTTLFRSRLHLELLGRVHRRDEGDVVARTRAAAVYVRGGVVRRPVQEELVVAVQAAVDREVHVVAVVEGARELRVAVELHARRERGEHDGVAPVQGQLRYALVLNDLPARGGVGLEERRLRADVDHVVEDRKSTRLNSSHANIS